MKVYAIVDIEAKAVASIFTAVNDATAERSFLSLLTGPRNVFTDFPEQFELYPVGELTYASGSLKVCSIGAEHLEAHGFQVDSYKVNDPVKSGRDYDRRYLRMVHEDIFGVKVENKESEVSKDE